MDQTSPAFPGSIETSRLKLRSPDLSDAEGMFASYTQDADVARYMVWQPHVSLKTTRDFVAGWLCTKGATRACGITLRSANADD